MTALTHSTDWHTASSAPALCRGPGAGTSGELDTETGVEPVQQTQGETVKAYTRAGADGDDFNLSCDGWERRAGRAMAWAPLTARTGGLVYHGVPTSLQSDSENPSLIHPSELGPRLRLRWTMAPPVRPGRGLAVYSDNRRFWWEWGAPTRFKYKLVMTPGFMDLIGTQIPRAVPSLVEAISCRQK